MAKELITHKNQSALRQMLKSMEMQLDNVKTSTDEVKGIATISGTRGGKQISVTIEENDIGKTGTFSEYESKRRKSDYGDEVRRLYKKGLKQQEIAFRLGISQSLVSKLINS